MGFLGLFAIGLSSALAGDAPEPLDCMFLPPDAQFRQFVGRATGESESEALATARLSARRQAADAVCAGQADIDACALAYRGVGFERDHQSRPERRRTWSACFTVEIAALLADPAVRQAKLQDEVAELALAIARKRPEGLIAVGPVVWDGAGCSTGYPGESLRDDLVTALTGRGVGVSTSATALPRVDLVLAGANDTGRLRAGWVTDSAVAGEALAPIAVDTRWYGLDPEARDACGLAQELSLTDGTRPGSDGRRVAVHMVDTPDSVCHAVKVPFDVVTDRRSRVALFSLPPEGLATYVADWEVDGTWRENRFQADWPHGGTEKIALVAVPIGTAAPWDRWTSGCTLANVADASAIPSTAAVALTAFSVGAPPECEPAPMPPVGPPCF